jgi:hypothetical protein
MSSFSLLSTSSTSTTQTNSQRASKSAAEVAAWQERCLVSQKSKDPAVIESIKLKCERSARATKSADRAKKMGTLNCYAQASSALTLSGFRSIQKTSTSSDYNFSFREGQEANARRSRAVQDTFCLSSAPIRSIGDSTHDEEIECQLDSISNEMATAVSEENEALNDVVFMARAAPEVAFVTVAKELTDLLDQLAIEPTAEDEITAKFGLFETYLETVKSIREQTLSFWEENKDQFLGGAKAAAESSIIAIDSNESLGILDDPSKWFVYWMFRKAQGNSESINNVLVKLRNQLQLLAQEDLECPCCLESIVPTKCVVLGCCHKVCDDCWDSWVALKGSGAFCPLCKHEEFIVNIMN